MALLRSRRVMLGFGVLLVSPALSGVALSKREDAQPVHRLPDSFWWRRPKWAIRASAMR